MFLLHQKNIYNSKKLNDYLEVNFVWQISHPLWVVLINVQLTAINVNQMSWTISIKLSSRVHHCVVYFDDIKIYIHTKIRKQLLECCLLIYVLPADVWLIQGCKYLVNSSNTDSVEASNWCSHQIISNVHQAKNKCQFYI